MTRALIGWMMFAAGILFMAFDVVQLNITGRFIVGMFLLLAWLGLIGGFRPEFWHRS